jgi:hypothetical protein
MCINIVRMSTQPELTSGIMRLASFNPDSKRYSHTASSPGRGVTSSNPNRACARNHGCALALSHVSSRQASQFAAVRNVRLDEFEAFRMLDLMFEQVEHKREEKRN